MLNTFILSILHKVFPKAIANITDFHQYAPLLTLRGCLINKLTALLTILKLSSITRWNTLVELTAYDTPSLVKRFTLNLFFLSIEYNYRIAVNLHVAQEDSIPSLSTVYVNSNWSEREVKEMFGVYFTNNLDLRRLLTDYGFEGFPLRKDFPLTGYFELRYDDELQQILYEPVQLTQEFRVFSLSSPWEKKEVI